MSSRFVTLVTTMLKVGCIGFGGGSALIPVLQREAVQEKKLITEEELDSGVVAASITPGALPVEIAAGIGKKTCGIPGMFAGAAAMAFPGAFLTTLLLVFASTVGPRLTWQIYYASVGITAYIIMVLIQYIISTLKKAQNNRGGMIQAAIVMLLVWLFSGEQKFFKLCGIQDTPIFGVSTVEIFIVAFFVIICTAGNFKSWWTVISGGVALLFLLARGQSHILYWPEFSWVLVGVMGTLAVVRLCMNFRTKEHVEKHEFREIGLEILLWLLFLIVCCIPALLQDINSALFVGQGALSALMSFGGGDAYLSVAQGLFVDTGMISTDEFYGAVVTMANILPGSILCKVLSGIGYVWGLDHTGTVFGGICVALAGFGSATATSCAVFGVAKILYDKWKEMSVFRALNDLIRPIVSGLLISVGMSLYGTNCTIEDNAGWGWGSVMILMIGIGIMVYVMQKKKVHMVWQVLASIAVSMVACNAFSVFG